jgi:hypothetical protein
MRFRLRRTGGCRMRRRRGRGKAWDWIKGAAGKVNNFLKRTKVLSKVAPTVMSAIPGAGAYSGMATSALNQLGYGRRRYRRRRYGGARRSRSRKPASCTYGTVTVPSHTRCKSRPKSFSAKLLKFTQSKRFKATGRPVPAFLAPKPVWPMK